MTGAEYQSGPMVDSMFYTLLQAANILCTTPSLSCQDDFNAWKENVDEAGNISRPDLYCEWGNTLLPCAMVPSNMTRENKIDSDDNNLNPFGGERGSRLWSSSERPLGLPFLCVSSYEWPEISSTFAVKRSTITYLLAIALKASLRNHRVDQGLEWYLLTRSRELRAGQAV